MQSDEPYHRRSSSNANLEYVPVAVAVPVSVSVGLHHDQLHLHDLHNLHNLPSRRYHDPPSSADDREPDDFYRPFAERPSQPDIVLRGGPAVDDDVMAAPAPAKRRHANLNGSTKPSSHDATPAGRPSTRSVSGPANPLSSTGPVLATAARARNSSALVKERLKQFDATQGHSTADGATRHARPRAPSASNPTFPSPGPRGAKNGIVASPRYRAGSSTAGRRPLLFGEVDDAQSAAEVPGYGVPRAEEEDSPDRRRSNAMFARSRSHSELELSPRLHSPRTTDPPLSPHHQRSQSDASALDSRSATVSPSSGRASPTLQMLSPQSRIPVSTARVRRASDMGLSKSALRQRPAAEFSPSSSFPLPASQKPSAARQTPNNRSPSPLMTLSARRYSPPKKLFEHATSLTAVVVPPPPVTSPSLRHTSKTRQPVSQATTKASQARATDRKVTDRFKPPSRDVSGTQARPKPSIPGNPSIAERSAILQQNLQGGASQKKPVRQDLKALQDKKRGVRVSDGAQSGDSRSFDGSSAESHTRGAPRLSLETANQEPAAPEENGGDVDTEFEESPILGPGSEKLPNIAYTPGPPDRAGHHPQVDDKHGQPHSLLKHVMSIRQSSSSGVSATARTQLPDDLLSDYDDGETIQILLGATPKLSQSNWQREEPNSSPDAFHTPREEGSPGDEGEGSDIDMFDGRSSIYPDDSVSVVFQRKYEDRFMASYPPVPPLPMNGAHLAARHDFTLDSDARSQINRVLDQYQEGHVTPEMAHGFQRHVESLTPQLSRHGAWESPEATKSYLKNLLGPEARQPALATAPMRVSIGPPTPPDPYAEESEASGGIAIIYAPSNPYDLTSRDSFEHSQTLHSHTASNSTLRPSREDDQQSYLDDLVFRPAPPPKDVDVPRRDSLEWSAERPLLPAINTGLGLSIGAPASGSPPKSPHPPAPTNAPPPPPSPRRNSSTGVLNQGQAPLSPVGFGKVLSPEQLVLGLPETPAPRGRLRRAETAAVDSGYTAESGKPSLEIIDDAPRPSSTGDLPANIPEKKDGNKLLKDRLNRIKELVDTEHSFHQDMTILMDIYMATSPSVLQEEDRRTLFGNVEQVRNFTTEFLDALKHAASSVYVIPRENRWNYKRGSFGTSNSGNTEHSSTAASASSEERIANDRNTTVGQVFCEHLAQIEKVYGDWLKGHSAANKRLGELQKLPAVKFWLDECHDNAKDITAAWSLDSLIIKPAQRLLKYPLLLTDLLKCTPADHPDHLALKQALEQITAAAGRINDLKRRAELVEEAMSKRREPDSKMKVGKLLNRRTEKLKQQVGISNLAEDQDYESVAQKFGGHFFQLQVVMRDVEKYLDDAQIYVEHFNSYIESIIQNIQTDCQDRQHEKESNWRRFAITLREMADVALPEHAKDVRRTVIDPIQQLWRLHVGPQKMMAKRKKRLVEYVRHKAQLERGEKPDKKLEQDAELFKAVNETLKDELPKLYALTKRLVEACLLNFIELQGMWQYTWQKRLEPFVERTDELFADDLPEFFSRVGLDFNADLMETEDRIGGFRICNGATLAEAQNFLSPATTFTKEDDASYKRPSTVSSSKRAQSLTGEQASLSTPNFGSRLSDNMGLSPLVGSFPIPDGVYQPSNGRGRAGSAMSSRGPSTPQSTSAYPGPSAYAPARPTTSSERGELSPGVPRMSLEAHSPATLDADTQFYYPDHIMPGAYTPDERFSGIFHSALPMSDSPRASSPDASDGEAKVLFLAASLFEFHIDSTRKEAGYPYLTYQPGEIFDVIGQKGELWLAKNQDDSSRVIGWIWEKHFARILPEN